MNKVALVTGANRGIGLQIALDLLARDWIVWLGVRSEEKGQIALAAAGDRAKQAQVLVMDASDENSIAAAAQSLADQQVQLDALVNNAAILLDKSGGLLQEPSELIYQTLHTNAMGPLLVIRHCLPLLSSGSRIVNISSGAGTFCSGVGTYAPVYSLSKTVLNVITVHIARDLQDRGIAVNAVCPGWVRTDMGGAGATRSVEQGADTPVWLATDAPAEASGKFWRDRQEIAW